MEYRNIIKMTNSSPPPITVLNWANQLYQYNTVGRGRRGLLQQK